MEKSFLQNEGGYRDCLKHQKGTNKGSLHSKDAQSACIIILLVMHTGQVLWKCLPQDPTLRAWLARNDHVKPCLVTCACKKPRNRMAVRSTIRRWRGKQRTDQQKSEMEAQNVKRSRIWKVEVQNGKFKVIWKMETRNGN